MDSLSTAATYPAGHWPYFWFAFAMNTVTAMSNRDFLHPQASVLNSPGAWCTVCTIRLCAGNIKAWNFALSLPTQITPAAHDCHRNNILNMCRHWLKGWIKSEPEHRPPSHFRGVCWKSERVGSPMVLHHFTGSKWKAVNQHVHAQNSMAETMVPPLIRNV
jgi:hypothetical protein